MTIFFNTTALSCIT